MSCASRHRFGNYILLFSALLISQLCLSSKVRNKNDMSLHQYTESGDVAQISYAARAVDKSSSGLLGFSQSDFAIVFVIRKKPSRLQVVQKSKPTIEICNKLYGIAVIGNDADCAYTRSKCNLVKQSHILRFGETPLIDNMSRTISRWLTRGMYIGDEEPTSRPVATSVLLFGRDDIETPHRLLMVESSGSVKECDFISAGYIPGGLLTLEKIKGLLLSERNKDATLRINAIIHRVSRVLFEAAGDFDQSDRKPNSDEQKFEIEDAESTSSLDIECASSDSSGLSASSFYSSMEKLSAIHDSSPENLGRWL